MTTSTFGQVNMCHIQTLRWPLRQELPLMDSLPLLRTILRVLHPQFQLRLELGRSPTCILTQMGSPGQTLSNPRLPGIPTPTPNPSP